MHFFCSIALQVKRLRAEAEAARGLSMKESSVSVGGLMAMGPHGRRFFSDGENRFLHTVFQFVSMRCSRILI